MSEIEKETEIPRNAFRDFLQEVVPQMQAVAGQHERLGRHTGLQAIRELRSISIDAGRQNGKTTGVKEFLLNHCKASAFKQTALYVDWFTSKAFFVREDEDGTGSFVEIDLGDVHDAKDIADNFLLHKYNVLVLTGSPIWHNLILERLGSKYATTPAAFAQDFIVILDK